MPFIHDASKQRVDALEAPKESLKSSESAGKVAGPKASDDKSGKAGPDRGDKLQMLKGDAKASDRARAHANEGVKGPGERLPHFDALQRAFGGHDLSTVQAHTDDRARQSVEGLGGGAYTLGSKVAFGGAPDLFTAAHEATHAVQQRAGVGPKGGAGRAGDEYERTANVVAEQVVAGNNVEGLLGPIGGASVGAESVALQGLHGDLSTPAQTQFGANEGESVQQATERLHGADTRDANFNNKRKVEFESKLAARLMSAGRSQFMPIVQAVSGQMYGYLKAREAEGVASLETSLTAMSQNMGETLKMGGKEVKNDIFFGRLKNCGAEIAGAPHEALARVLRGEAGSPSQHLFAHHQFMDFVYGGKGGDFATKTASKVLAKLQSKGLESVKPEEQSPEQKKVRGLQEEMMGNMQTSEENLTAPKSLREGVTSDTGKSHVDIDFGGVGRGRESPTMKNDKGETVRNPKSGVGREFYGAMHNPSIGFAHGVQQRPAQRGMTDVTDFDPLTEMPKDISDQKHSRGIDLQTMDEAAAFIQQARVELDMPLGGSVSGTTTDMLEAAKIFGVQGDQLMLYSIGVLAHLQSAGAHTFHEIATAAQQAGISYTPGDYESFLPGSVKAICQDLLKEYEDVLKPQTTPTPKAP